MTLQPAVPQAESAAALPAGSLPPASAGRPVRALAALLPLSLVAVVSLGPVVGSNPLHGGGRALLVTLAALTLLALLARQFGTARLGLALVATIAAFALPWQASWWPLPGAVGVGAYLLAAQLGPTATAPGAPPAARGGWLGRLTRTEVGAVAALAAVASAALLIFHRLTPPALSFGAGLVSQLPTWTIALAGMAFVTVNAAVEEIMFRGVILAHLTPAVGIRAAVILQAAGFGLLNLHGYPYGPVGVALTAAYGVLLGLLRLKSGGLLACWIAHALADSVIFCFILQAAATHSR